MSNLQFFNMPPGVRALIWRKLRRIFAAINLDVHLRQGPQLQTHVYGGSLTYLTSETTVFLRTSNTLKRLVIQKVVGGGQLHTYVQVRTHMPTVWVFMQVWLDEEVWVDCRQQIDYVQTVCENTVNATCEEMDLVQQWGRLGTVVEQS